MTRMQIMRRCWLSTAGRHTTSQSFPGRGWQRAPRFLTDHRGDRPCMPPNTGGGAGSGDIAPDMDGGALGGEVWRR